LNYIEIADPGGTFWLIGRSGTGCISDTIFKTLTVEPDWEFLTHADTTICGKRSVILSASGADSYLWNNGTTNDSVTVSSPGKYILRGANRRGCMKSAIFNVMQYRLPAVDFSVLPDALDSRHNKLTCIISAEPGVQYAWNMGDGSSETGPGVQHEYSISKNSQQYKVTLNATTEYGCTDTSFIIVDVFPFIPNVFTPDGDGINEVFMEGFELEIVDRNGLKIYNGNAGWDGRYNGELADPDTYFYLIFFNDNKQIIQSRKGYVTLVR
jgi:gliding motility-associated-like protein